MLGWFAGWSVDDWLKLAALIGAATAFIVGLGQYRKAQKWKQAEWVAQEMQGFFSDTAVCSALRLIDWSSRRVDLFPNESDPEKRSVKVSDARLAKALERHSDRPEGFDETEAALRDMFDHFLDRVERINCFVHAGLVSLTEVRPYLDYWAESIATKSGENAERIVKLRRYIRFYGFSGAESLFTKLCGQPFPQDAGATDAGV
jgi:hypothetical protein